MAAGPKDEDETTDFPGPSTTWASNKPPSPKLVRDATGAVVKTTTKKRAAKKAAKGVKKKVAKPGVKPPSAKEGIKKLKVRIVKGKKQTGKSLSSPWVYVGPVKAKVKSSTTEVRRRAAKKKV